MAEHVKYYDCEPGRTVTCPSCRWIGSADEQQEFHGDLFDVSCGGCGQLLLIVSFPTLGDVREAAAAGNERAIIDLPEIEKQASARAEARAMQLERADQLPELLGDALAIEWACVDTPDGEHWQVLRHGDREFWRERAYYESYPRFEQIFAMLLERYGTRFVRLQPTEDSLSWLYGDSFSAGSRIHKLNESLRKHLP